MPIFMRPAVTLMTGSMLLAGLSGCSGGLTESDSWVSVIVYDGHTYFGQGDLERDPEVTGRSMPAALPGCDDPGGQSEGEKDEAVRVEELVVAPSTALLWDGSSTALGRTVSSATSAHQRCALRADERTCRSLKNS
jgi:hypothetical protein